MIVQANTMPPLTEGTPAVAKMGIIYGLIDPRYGHVRYGGQTVHTVKRRFNRHLQDARSGQVGYRNDWIRKLLSLKVEPFPVVLMVVPIDQLDEAEIRLITALREECAFYGHPCVNTTEGGAGGAPMRGRHFTEEHKAKLRAIMNSPQYAWRGKHHTPEALAKIAAASRGRSASAETRAKMSAARRALRGVTPFHARPGRQGWIPWNKQHGPLMEDGSFYTDRVLDAKMWRKRNWHPKRLEKAS